MGMSGPSKAQITRSPQYESHPEDKFRELQVGDVIFDVSAEQFGIVFSIEREVVRYRARSGIDTDAGKEQIALVTGNLLGKESAPEHENLIGAETQAELNFAEQLGFWDAVNYIKPRLPEIPIGEATMQHLHREIFGPVYSWGGRYRKEPIVVGRHDSPTPDWREVPWLVKEFFRSFRSPLLRQAHKSRQHMLEAQLELHRELAGIHPFHDGNGRIIRLLSDILALEWGFEMRWDFEGVPKGRYHSAVRRAVHGGNSTYLRRLLDRFLIGG